MPPSLPPPVPEPEPVSIPIAAVLAPALAGAVLAALTGSSLPLALAALGPLIALASVLDGRWQRRRSRRRAVRRRAEAMERLQGELQRELAERRGALLASTPGAAALVGRPPASAALPVVLGFGPVPSGLALPPVEPGDETLAAAAAVLEDAPVTAPPAVEVSVVGRAPVLVAAVARALALQGARIAPPLVGSSRPSAPVIVRVDGVRRARIVAHPLPAARVPIRPELISAVEAAAHRREPIVAFPALGVPERRGLVARFAATADWPLDIDLAAEGPHAVVGGTTGSGKSELLLSWVLGLARVHPPETLAVLLLDFKGGATFDALAALPHVAGVVTDLDDTAVERLAIGLRAEVRRRETLLRERRARDADEVPDLPRLVIVVDELAALLAARPVLGEVFTDLAARGRALGVSLVLCTQRPAGVVSEALLANCGLRIALRMLSPEDSRSLLGTVDAAGLPRTEPGRCLVVRHGDPPVDCRVAIAGAADVDSVAASWAGARSSAPVWLPPLPSRIPLAELAPTPPDGLVVGLLDLPEERRRAQAVWRPGAEGALLAVGTAGSGRSTLLSTLAAQDESLLIQGGRADAGEALWDVLAGGESAALLLVDDLDLALAALPDEYAGEAADRLALALRGRTLRMAATARAPLAAPLRPVAALSGRLLVLATGRDDHALLTGGGTVFDPRLPPGGGWWNGHRVQIAQDALPEPILPAPSRSARIDFTEPLLVLTRFPERRLAQLERLLGGDGRDRGIEVLAVDDFTASPALWPLAVHRPLLLDGCSPAEHRVITRRRGLPPVLAPLPDRAWLVRPEQATRRVLVDWEG